MAYNVLFTKLYLTGLKKRNEKMKKYTKEEFLKAAELGEVSMIDAKHIVSLLDEIKMTRKEYQKQYQKEYAASGKKSEAAKRYYQKHKYEICEKLKNKRKNLQIDK